MAALVRCDGSAECYLHLHGMSSWDSMGIAMPAVYSNPSAPGGRVQVQMLTMMIMLPHHLACPRHALVMLRPYMHASNNTCFWQPHPTLPRVSQLYGGS
jgi:hypothetical protein